MRQDSLTSHPRAWAWKKITVINHIQRPPATIRRYLLKEVFTESLLAIYFLWRCRARLPPELPAIKISATAPDYQFTVITSSPG